MSRETRSHDACWTCRLRKKKCDEKRPICESCWNLKLECSYGRKPNWMDGGEHEGSQRQKTKLKVARVLRERRFPRTVQYDQAFSPSLMTLSSSQSSSSCQDEVFDNNDIQPAADSSDASSSPSLEEFSFSTELYLSFAEAQTLDIQDPDLSIRTEQSFAGTVSDRCSTFHALSYQDMSLMVYYIDHVYQWQFCGEIFGKPVLEKSLVIWLACQSQPLLLAILSLSALHQSMSQGSSDLSPENNCAKDVDLRYEMALNGFRQALAGLENETFLNDESVDLWVLSCIKIFLSMSVRVNIWKGGFLLKQVLQTLKNTQRGWRAHLDAAIALIVDRKLPGRHSIPAFPADSDRALSQSRLRQFLSCSMLWYDLLSNIMPSCKPQSYENYAAWFNPSARTVFLQDTVGCQEWVLLCLVKVYKLRDWQEDLRCRGKLSLREMVQKAEVTRKELEEGLIRVSILLEEGAFNIYLITSVFARSVSVLLEVVVSGPHPGLPEIQENTAGAMVLLRCITDPRLVRALVWPLCIIGCMVEPLHYNFFRDFLISKSAYDVQILDQLIKIVETCWTLRALRETGSERGVSWKDAFKELQLDILLV